MKQNFRGWKAEGQWRMHQMSSEPHFKSWAGHESRRISIWGTYPGPFWVHCSDPSMPGENRRENFAATQKVVSLALGRDKSPMAKTWVVEWWSIKISSKCSDPRREVLSLPQNIWGQGEWMWLQLQQSPATD